MGGDRKHAAEAQSKLQEAEQSVDRLAAQLTRLRSDHAALLGIDVATVGAWCPVPPAAGGPSAATVHSSPVHLLGTLAPVRDCGARERA